MFILSQKEEGGKERFSEDSKNSTHSKHFQRILSPCLWKEVKTQRNPAEIRLKISKARIVFLRNVWENNFDIVRVGEYDRGRRKCTKKIE